MITQCELQECPNIEEIIESLKIEEAYIMITAEGTGEMQYHIVVDGLFMYTCDNLPNALIDLLCYYYILNIAYPKALNAVYLFLQNFILGIKDSVRLPNSVVTLYSNLL